MLWFVKRLTFILKLKRACAKQGYALIPLRKYWVFGGIRGEHSDFCVVTEDKVYSVKLATSHHRRVYYCFNSPTCYSVTSWQFPVRATNIQPEYKYYEKAPYSFDCDCEFDKDQINVLLFSPTPSCVFISEENEKRIARNGDWMGEAVCYGEQGFLTLLNS